MFCYPINIPHSACLSKSFTFQKTPRIIQVRVAYSNPVSVPICNTGISIGASLIITIPTLAKLEVMKFANHELYIDIKRKI